jgi:hypothetical protein
MQPLTTLVISTLKSIENKYSHNELAYLALTQKVEHAVRDKLAYLLHLSLEDKPSLLVCREWLRADLAIIQHEDPLLVLEAKAIYSFDLINEGCESNIAKLVEDDLKKATKFAHTDSIARPLEALALVIATHPNTAPSDDFKQAVKYHRAVKKHANELNNYQAACSIMDQKMNGFELLHSQQISAGSAFGVDVSIFFWLYRPKQNLNLLDS